MPEYSLKNLDYSTAAPSGSYHYGINGYLTVESHAEGASVLALGGVGGVVKIDHHGVLNSSYPSSCQDGQSGNQVSWGYQHNYNVSIISTH